MEKWQWTLPEYIYSGHCRPLLPPPQLLARSCFALHIDCRRSSTRVGCAGPTERVSHASPPSRPSHAAPHPRRVLDTASAAALQARPRRHERHRRCALHTRRPHLAHERGKASARLSVFCSRRRAPERCTASPHRHLPPLREWGARARCTRAASPKTKGAPAPPRPATRARPTLPTTTAVDASHHAIGTCADG